jgi:hypothetical protein
MRCTNCNKEIPEESLYCPVCGIKVIPQNNESSEIKNNTQEFQNTSFEQNAYAQTYDYNETFVNKTFVQGISQYEITSVKNMMLYGLIAQCTTLIPYLNTLTLIPAFVLTIIGLFKVKSFADKYDLDLPSFKPFFYTYIGSIIFYILAFIICVIFGIIIGVSGADANSETYGILLGLFAIIAMCISIGVNIWGLVVWIMTNSELDRLLALNNRR